MDPTFDRPIGAGPADQMGDLPKFKFICDACGSMSIKVEHPDLAPEATVVECGRCNAPRGTLAALRDLARRGRNDLLEF
jgi:predicted Zn finger-like uncharacterized protein